jgi:2-C-methyl-D-erythritol 4-phosphate cytidylyltransferase
VPDTDAPDLAARNVLVWTVVVAAGAGSRFGSPKQFAPLAGRRVLDVAVAAAAHVSDGIVVVAPDGTEAPGAHAVVEGGATRSASVRAGLAAVPESAEVIVVHDAARPLAPPDLFGATVDAVLAGADGAIPVVPVTDSLRHRRHGPVDRDQLVAVQTPQAFRAACLRAAHASAPEATDDAAVVEAAGGRIELVAGDRWNLKITEPDDLVVASAVLAARS